MSRTITHAAEPRSALLADLVDRLTARVQAGELLDPVALAAEFPEFADDLARLIPALDLLGELSRSREPIGGTLGSGDAMDEMKPGLLGDYRIIREVGHGGMGIVYEAEQVSLCRRVALKVLPFAAMMDPRHLQRFRNEARAAAGLDHPHVVKVYGVGCERGVHFIAMQFVDGQTLADLICERRGDSASESPKDRRPGAEETLTQARNPVCGASTATHMPDVRPAETPRPTEPAARASSERMKSDAAYFRRVAEWGIQAADALEHAHALGVVHRDVKPANLMVDGRGELFVADFGLARVSAGEGMTEAGALLGTPRYMSPEQAAAAHGLVDHRTDVYALGATLYELLTLAPAVGGNDRVAVLANISGTEPILPRKVDRGVPVDLETVVLKCLRKEAGERYQSAKELAADLRRWLGNLPLQARREDRLKKARRWCRRNPALTALAAVILFAAAALSATTFLFWNEKQFAEEEKRARQDADNQRAKAISAREDAEAAQRREETIRRTLDRVTYLNRVRLAYREWQEGNILRMNQLLQDCPIALRGWEWRYVNRLMNTAKTTFAIHTSLIRAADISSDGSRAITGDDDGNVYVWDTSTGARISQLRGHLKGVWGVAFGPDGELAVTSGVDGTVRLWNTKTGASKWSVNAHTGSANGVSFSPNGKYVCSIAGNITLAVYSFHGVGGSPKNEVKIWEVSSGREIRTIPLSGASPECVAYSPNGKCIATGQFDGTVSIWESESGQRLQMFRRNTTPVWGIAFSPDGRQLAASYNDGMAVLRQIDDGQLLANLPHPATVRSISFGDDGKSIVTASDDALVRVWDRSGNLTKTIRGHKGIVNRCVAHSTGRMILSSSHDATARIWDGRIEQQFNNLGGHTNWVTGVAVSHDGSKIASVGRDGLLCTWDSATLLLESRRINTISDVASPVSFSPSGSSVAVVGKQNAIELWDPLISKRLGSLVGHTACAHELAFSHDGSLLASSAEDFSVRIWDLESHRLRSMARTTPPSRLGWGRGVSFSPVGKLLAYGDSSDLVLWDLTSETRTRLQGHSAPITSVAFSPDGLMVASASHDHTIRVWNPRTGSHLYTCTGHSNMIHEMSFSPDGSRLASAGEDATIRVWLSETGEEALSLVGASSAVYSVAFMKDGERLVSGDSMGSVRIWNVLGK